jgi:hypothetical protein
MYNPVSIGNTHVGPSSIGGNYANTYSSDPRPFTSNAIPGGPHTLPHAGSNIQGAAGKYQCGGATNKKTKIIDRNKINKISRKYKMKRSLKRKTRQRKHRCTKSCRHRHHSKRRGTHRMKGGATPLYPAGYSQYDNNNGSLSNTYSLGGVLVGKDSALANPPPYQRVDGQPDNLNHAAPNSYGNIGAGSGVASRGWF